ncbi:GerMN domain-containing protein [Amphibacillus cookii]|uniref:GerMN domain-containing protein n=1 Tax=Amphibacillus cookii TaxID=767787 RepID=UPI00195A84BB|nr:GerMN domain-containing protein [Amphibacillus cookii]MBM7541833.1 germination protein M [Amphibacillus cookii]
MNKRVLIRSIGLSLLLIFSVLTVSGCGIFNSEDTLEDIDVPKEEEQEDEEELVEDDQTEGEEQETVARQLFLISEEGIVVPQTIEIPKADSNEVATQVLEYLVKDGPVSQLLPNGFEAVLPVGTEILGLNLQEDGTMIVDLSNEFKEYEASKEQQIIQAMTYTLTQFDNVDKVKLWINGFELTEMPVNGTPIMNGYSRANGINLIESEAIDLLNSEAVTVYYPTQLGPNFHYVPVTQHIEIDSDNRYQSIVQALLDGPSYQSNFLHVFNPNVEILDIEELEDGILSIEFTEEILADVNEAYIADEVIETLVLTLTDQPDVSALSISVADIEQVFNEHGVPYIEPVTRDTFVPTGSL